MKERIDINEVKDLPEWQELRDSDRSLQKVIYGMSSAVAVLFALLLVLFAWGCTPWY